MNLKEKGEFFCLLAGLIVFLALSVFITAIIYCALTEGSTILIVPIGIFLLVFLIEGTFSSVDMMKGILKKH